MRSTRGLVLLFASVTAVIALRPPGGIVALTALSGSLYAACFFPSIVFGLHWRPGNGTAVITSFALGMGTLLLWDFLPFAAAVHKVFPAVLLSTIGYLAAAWMGRANETDEINRLFERQQRAGDDGHGNH